MSAPHALTVAEMPITCCLYGLGIRVNVPISGLAGLPPAGQVDVEISLGAMPAELNGRGEQDWHEYHVSSDLDFAGRPSLKGAIYRNGKYFRIAYADGTVLVIDAAGTCVWATAPDGATVEDTATYLLGPALGFVLRRRGIACLHASAIAIDGSAVALVGSSGAGKSSTAAAFARRGYAILSDDVAALADDALGFAIQPAYPRVRLWPETVESLFGHEDALQRITPSWDKRFLDLNGGPYRFQRQALPLAAIYLLGIRGAVVDSPFISEVSVADALISVVSDTSTTNLLDRASRGKELEVLARLVQTVPVKRVTPSGDIARIDELCDLIAADFRQIPN